MKIGLRSTSFCVPSKGVNQRRKEIMHSVDSFTNFALHENGIAPSHSPQKGISNRNTEWTLKVTEQEKALDAFVVRARRTNNKVVAEFEPPNTERVTLQVKGVHKVTPAGSGQVLEQIVLADAQSGQLMVFTRFKKAK